MQLWSLLMPDRVLPSRVTIEWQDIGFQGTDPKTDFRGMGLLGLENLLCVSFNFLRFYREFLFILYDRFFAENYTDTARHVLSHARHPKHG